MNALVLNIVLAAAVSANALQGTSLPETARGYELVATTGFLKARIFCDGDTLLLDFPYAQRGYLFKTDSYFLLNRSNKTYAVHSYANMISSVRRWSPVDGNSLEDVLSKRRAGSTFKEETDLIAGLPTTKFVTTNDGEVAQEIWISEEITPALRAVGHELRTLLPANYFNDEERLPLLFQVILALGLPLRIVNHGSQPSIVEVVAIKTEDIPAAFSMIPFDYQPSNVSISSQTLR